MPRYKVDDQPIPGYRLMEFLGRGGFGEVWRASGPGTVQVALKIIGLERKQGLKEFKALRLVKGIHHPNLVPIMGAWLIGEHGEVMGDTHLDDLSATRLSAKQQDQQNLAGTMVVSEAEMSSPKALIIAMGLGDMSLADRLEQIPDGIPIDELIEYMRESAKAIDFLNERAHDLGSGSAAAIQHCDIKPQNILIVGGSAQVCDFGLARVLGDVRMTAVAVSPAYGAPECIDGNKPSPTTDQYSLAVSYVELRTGQLPFDDTGSYMDIVNAHLESRLDISRLPALEQPVIKRATARDPADRYPSATEMIRALAKASLQGDSGRFRRRPVSAPPPPPPDEDEFGDQPVPLDSGTVPVEVNQNRTPATDPSTLIVDGQPADMRRTTQRQYDDTRPEGHEEEEQYVVEPGARPRYGLLVGLLVLLLIGSIISGVVFESRRVSGEIRSLITKGKLDEAVERLDSAPLWFAWLLPKRQLRKDLVSDCSTRVKNAISNKEFDTAADLVETADWAKTFDMQRWTETRKNVADGWCKHFEIERARGKAQADNIWDARNKRFPNDDCPKVDIVVLMLNESESLINKGNDSYASNPDECIKEYCDNALDVLSTPEIRNLPDERKQDQDRAQRLRGQALLLRARANSRVEPRPWKSVRKDLDEFENSDQHVKSPSRDALAATLRVICEADSPSLGFDETIDVLVRCQRLLVAAGQHEDQWSPDDAEKSQLREAGQSLLPYLRQKVTDASSQRAEAVELADKFLAYRAGDVEMLLFKAGMQCRLREFDEWSKTLQKAREFATAAQQAEADSQIVFWTTLMSLKNADHQKMPTETQAAIDGLDASRGKVPLDVLLEFATELIQIAEESEGDENLRTVCMGKMSIILKDLPKLLESQERDDLQGRLVGLQDRFDNLEEKIRVAVILAAEAERKTLLKSIAEAINSPARPNFLVLLSKCENAEEIGLEDALIKVCKAECTLETSGLEPSPSNWQTVADVILDDHLLDELDPQYGPYVSYVRALLYESDPGGTQTAQAAGLVQQAFAGADNCPALVNPHRRGQAALILIAASTTLRGSGSNKGFEDLLGNPYADPADSDRAFKWLELAVGIAGSGEVSSTARLNLAMAALYKSNPDQALADQISEEIGAKLAEGDFAREDVPALYVYAQAKSREPIRPEDRMPAILAYAELLRLSQQEEKLGHDAVPPMVVYEKIIDPGLALADSFRPSIVPLAANKERIGSLYGAKGSVVRDNRYLPWGFDNPREEALKAYEQAISYDDNKAEYLAGRGCCHLELGNQSQAIDDANAAIEADGTSAEGYSLLGNAYLAQSRALDIVSQRVAKLDEAVAQCTKAVELSKKDDKGKAYVLINRSVANVEIVSYSVAHLTPELITAKLESARDDALAAIEIDTSFNDFAYHSLGNALEDLAWLAGQDKENYNRAIVAFTNALKLSSTRLEDNATYWLARGRCKYKAVAYGNFSDSLLDEATIDLEKAIQLDESLPEAYMWLGRVYFSSRKHDLAEKACGQALELMEELDDGGASSDLLYPVYYLRAQSLLELKKPTEADRFFAAAVKSIRAAGSAGRTECLDLWIPTIIPEDPNTRSRLQWLTPTAKYLVDSRESTPQAKLFIGIVQESQDEWEEAAAAYSQGIDLAKPQKNNDLLYKLYYRRSRANCDWLMSKATEPVLQGEILKKIGEDLYRDADLAAAHAPGDTVRVAEAMAQAGTARIRAAVVKGRTTPEGKRLWSEAKPQFLTAIKTDPKHKQGWTWRLVYVAFWQYFEQPLTSEKKTEAIRLLDEALGFETLNSIGRQEIGRLKESLQRSGRP